MGVTTNVPCTENGIAVNDDQPEYVPPVASVNPTTLAGDVDAGTLIVTGDAVFDPAEDVPGVVATRAYAGEPPVSSVPAELAVGVPVDRPKNL